MMLYVENLKEPSQKLSKVAGWKNHIKTQSCSYTLKMNGPKKEIKKTIFLIASKEIRYLGVNLKS